MPHTVGPATEAVVRAVWAARLGAASEAFAAARASFVERRDLTAVVVVRLGRSTVVAGPKCALDDLRALSPGLLVDAPTVLASLTAHAPVLLGAASLAYTDRSTVTPMPPGALSMASDAAVDDVMSRCTSQERDESGLVDMAVRLIAADETGRPVAVAGYEVWAGRIAQLGVVVVAHRRRMGLGQLAAAAAAHHAIDAGLVAQWRCRLDNRPSALLGDRLGFVRHGVQVALEVGCR